MDIKKNRIALGIWCALVMVGLSISLFVPVELQQNSSFDMVWIILFSALIASSQCCREAF